MKKSTEQIPVRINKKLYDELYIMKGELEKKHKRDISINEVSKTLTEASYFQKLKKEVIDFAVDLDGSGWDYIIFGVTALILCLFFIFYSFAFHTGYTYLHQVTTPASSNINITPAIEGTFGQVDESYNNLRWLGVLMIFSSFISIMVSNYFVRDYPISFLVYVNV